MKEQIKAPEKIQLSNKEIANLSDAEFKAQIIRMLTEMVEYGCKMKTLKSEIKEYIQVTDSEGKETGTQINNFDQKEDINMQAEQNEETRIQKTEERLQNVRDNFEHSNI